MCCNWSTTNATFPPLAGNMGNKVSAKITVLHGRSYMVHDVRVSYASANKTETVEAPLANLALPAHHHHPLSRYLPSIPESALPSFALSLEFCLDSLVGRRFATRPLRCHDSGHLNLKSLNSVETAHLFSPVVSSEHANPPATAPNVIWRSVASDICLNMSLKVDPNDNCLGWHLCPLEALSGIRYP